MITQTGSGVPRHVEGAAEPIAVPVRQDLQKAHGHRGDSGLTTLEWLLIVAAVAGLAALAVVLVQRVVSDTSEQIAGNSARQTAAKVAGVQVADKARAAGLETGADHDEINQDGKRECDRLKILYSDAGITTNYTDGEFAGSVWTTDPDCPVTASGDTATPGAPGKPGTPTYTDPNLAWTAATGTVTSYQITCTGGGCPRGGGPWTAAGTATQVNVGSLTAGGGAYSFTVTAMNSGGNTASDVFMGTA